MAMEKSQQIAQAIFQELTVGKMKDIGKQICDQAQREGRIKTPDQAQELIAQFVVVAMFKDEDAKKVLCHDVYMACRKAAGVE
jgi:L,D-peptidoglycan transpeptidase YkuD (ErfK/YbiS/YcfS/YnhG family)